MSGDEAHTEKTLDERLVKIKFNVDLPIKNIILKKPDVAGSCFASSVHCASVNFAGENEQTLELFIKEPVKHTGLGDVIKKSAYFERESSFYKILYRDIVTFCEQKQQYDGFLQPIIPKCYYANETLVVLENLTTKGFTLLNKLEPHCYKAARVVMETLAKLHAASYAFIEEVELDQCKEKYPSFMTANLWCEANWKSLKGPFVRAGIDGAIKVLQLYPTHGSSQVLAHIRNYQTDDPSSEKYFDLKDGSYATVLCHGDCWNGNIMWQLNSKTEDPERCCLLDFQTTHLGRPGVDLATYLFLVVDSDVRRQHWKTFLHSYFAQFKKCAASLGCTVKFTFKDLLVDFSEFREIGFILSLFPIVAASAITDMQDMDSVEGDIAQYFEAKFSSSLDRALEDRGWAMSQAIVRTFAEYEKLATVLG